MKTTGNRHTKRITTGVLAFFLALAFAFTLPLAGCCGCPAEREIVIDEVEDERVEENLLDRAAQPPKASMGVAPAGEEKEPEENLLDRTKGGDQ